MKKRISLDIDEVLRAQIPEIIRQSALLHGSNLTLADFNSWDAPLGHKCGMSNEEFDNWAWGNASVALLAQPLPYAVEAVNFLNQEYEVIMTTSSGAPEETLWWLKRHGFKCEQVIFTSEKHLVDCDVHVDDSLSHIRKFVTASRPIIKMVAPNNRNGVIVPTMTGWGDLSIINKIISL